MPKFPVKVVTPTTTSELTDFPCRFKEHYGTNNQIVIEGQLYDGQKFTCEHNYSNDRMATEPPTIVKMSVDPSTVTPISEKMVYLFSQGFFILNQKTLEITFFQFNGKVHDFVCEKIDENACINLTFTSGLPQEPDFIKLASYNGVLKISQTTARNYFCVFVPTICGEYFVENHFSHLFGVPIIVLDKILRIIFKNTKTKAIIEPRKEYSFSGFLGSYEVSDEFYGDLHARICLEKNLKIPGNDARKIVEDLRKIVEKFNQEAAWEFPPKTERNPPLSEICIPEIWKTPQLKILWKNISEILNTWEKDSQQNWSEKRAHKQKFALEQKHFYNPERFYFQMCVPHFPIVLPQEILAHITSFLPPLFYGGTLFYRKVDIQCVIAVIIENALIKFFPETNQYIYCNECDDDGFYTFVRVEGTFSVKNSEIHFTGKPMTVTGTPNSKQTAERSVAKITIHPVTGGLVLSLNNDKFEECRPDWYNFMKYPKESAITTTWTPPKTPNKCNVR